MTIPTFERFRAFQGEGIHMGRPAFFIRTYGCPLHCPYCDSAGTWHKDYVPKDVERISTDRLQTEALEEPRVEFVVITGGEPAVHDLQPLVDKLNSANLPVHIETSGTFRLPEHLRWVTMSPKRWKLPPVNIIQQADEFKFIIEKPDDIYFYTSVVMKAYPDEIPVPIWLHPEWSQRENPTVLKSICQAVVGGRGRYRAGWQIHKGYKVDQGDNRSRPSVPLGGNPKKGF